MSRINAIATSAKISARLAAVAIFLAAGSLAAPVQIPLVGPDTAVAKPVPLAKGSKRIKGKVGRGQVGKACKQAGGWAWGTGKKASRKDGYGCYGTKKGNWIDCNSKGQCTGGNEKQSGKNPD